MNEREKASKFLNVVESRLKNQLKEVRFDVDSQRKPKASEINGLLKRRCNEVLKGMNKGLHVETGVFDREGWMFDLKLLKDSHEIGKINFVGSPILNSNRLTSCWLVKIGYVWFKSAVGSEFME